MYCLLKKVLVQRGKHVLTAGYHFVLLMQSGKPKHKHNLNHVFGHVAFWLTAHAARCLLIENHSVCFGNIQIKLSCVVGVAFVVVLYIRRGRG